MKRTIIALLTFPLGACAYLGALHGGVVNTDHVRTVAAWVQDANGHGIEGATCKFAFLPAQVSNADGYIAWDNVSSNLRSGDLTCSKDGYATALEQRTLLTGENEDLLPMVLTRLHVDPAEVPLEALARIRGSMWTARLNLPYGPRPGQESNILAMNFYSVYSAEDRARMLEAYKAHGYTHAVTGPVTGNDCYHGQYPCHRGVPSQVEWDAYLDDLQEWWDAGVTPIYFAKPDETLEPGEMAALDALYAQERAQRLLRVVVYTGWEPWGKYAKTNAGWVQWVMHGAQVFPHALRLIHMVGDVDAPTGGNDDQVLRGGNATAWTNVAPFLHGWLVQNAGYVFGSTPLPSPGFLLEFKKQFDLAYAGSLVNRFQRGYAGWPRGSAWGPDQPLKVYAGEYAAYAAYWKNWPEEEAINLGNIAVQAGADGYLDGGSIAVR